MFSGAKVKAKMVLAELDNWEREDLEVKIT